MRALSTLGISLRKHPLPNPPPQAGEGAHQPYGTGRLLCVRQKSPAACERLHILKFANVVP
ncbi:hypothetical protein EAS62_14680 [Bradyrhizobium zhanjiangense]|uniref:Uncharacterized protein n=1 Tax=Bradyrhizobium zhanjiangense TaxID=1325107 RepID=A0ABY0DM65_9BRAD|nr:hypothetical protein EAS62_14680 [Bradyrhizobium zhanjiangense]